MKIYLDVCCLNRPFDDQGQERIRLEAEAVLLIIARMESGQWQWLSSEVVEDEINQNPDLKRRERLQNLIIHAQESFILTENEIDRAVKLRKIGFGDMDALHLACAESGKVDVFLTTDDKLVRRATRLTKQLYVTVDNPLSWLVTIKGTRTG
jgi:predicted nucleic acid-binding protein